jgi:transposase
MTYSIDFRRKVLAIKAQENLSFEEAARRFGVGKASLSRWSGRLEPRRTRDKPPLKIKDEDEDLRRDVELYPDAYQHERAARLGASQQGVCEALKRLKISVKKNAVASEGRRATR